MKSFRFFDVLHWLLVINFQGNMDGSNRVLRNRTQMKIVLYGMVREHLLLIQSNRSSQPNDPHRIMTGFRIVLKSTVLWNIIFQTFELALLTADRPSDTHEILEEMYRIVVTGAFISYSF